MPNNPINPSILIVEDEKPLLEALTDKFQSEGFTIHQAKDGVSGLSLAFKFHPSVIILDIVMPLMDGFTMLEKLRQDSWGENVKVIVLTNLPIDDARLSNVIKHQPSYYLIKSEHSLKEIIEKTRELLEPSISQ